jgi:hypothetical protein
MPRAATATIRVSSHASAAPISILDLGLEPLDAGARHDLLEILEDRYGRLRPWLPPSFRDLMA